MAYQVYYPSGCGTTVGDHYCNNCEVAEHARIRSVAYIAKDFTFIDPTNPVEWKAGIAAKKIIVIPETSGSFDGGSEVEGTGYGDQQSKLTGYNFQLTYQDPNYKNNADFYNGLKRTSNYRVAYRTESLVHISLNTVSVIPKNPVTDNLSDEVTWSVLVKWSEGDLPVPYNVPSGIFVCYDYSGVIS
ncbi:MAG: hypothetical protein H0X33_14075 [Taibaiella sp.]|nr:hypothetical protein [Taibaiella sp.]